MSNGRALLPLLSRPSPTSASARRNRRAGKAVRDAAEQWGAQQNRQLVCQRTCGLMFNRPFERGTPSPWVTGGVSRIGSAAEISAAARTSFFWVPCRSSTAWNAFQLRGADRLGGLQKQKNGGASLPS
jgi:hypothetical protein